MTEQGQDRPDGTGAHHDVVLLVEQAQEVLRVHPEQLVGGERGAGARVERRAAAGVEVGQGGQLRAALLARQALLVLEALLSREPLEPPLSAAAEAARLARAARRHGRGGPDRAGRAEHDRETGRDGGLPRRPPGLAHGRSRRPRLGRRGLTGGGGGGGARGGIRVRRGRGREEGAGGRGRRGRQHLRVAGVELGQRRLRALRGGGGGVVAHDATVERQPVAALWRARRRAGTSTGGLRRRPPAAAAYRASTEITQVGTGDRTVATASLGV